VPAEKAGADDHRGGHTAKKYAHPGLHRTKIAQRALKGQCATHDFSLVAPQGLARSSGEIPTQEPRPAPI